jgi:hypothetical protein
LIERLQDLGLTDVHITKVVQRLLERSLIRWSGPKGVVAVPVASRLESDIGPRSLNSKCHGRYPRSGALVAGVPDKTLAALKQTVLYSEELGIELRNGRETELFKWFLASLLLGARISEKIGKRTYRAFTHHDLLTPRRIVTAGWDYLVEPVMREGGYVRYDGKKSTQILRNCQTLLDRYHGKCSRIHEQAANAEDLEARLLAFYGVGPVTVNIFLRELRPFWRKADPQLLPSVRAAAERLGLDLDAYNRKTLSFVRIEAGLIRRRRRGRPAHEDHLPLGGATADRI